MPHDAIGLIPAAPYEAASGAETLFVQPAVLGPVPPPLLLDVRAADPALGREFLTVMARSHAACPAEAVLLLRDALVLDGSYVLARDGVAVKESYYNVQPGPEMEARQRGQLARIAAGDVATLPEAGGPVVAVFLQDVNNFGHMLGEMLPRLMHLARVGVRRFRLLVPQQALAMEEMIRFALSALGLEAELVACPEGSILRVPALHWVSLVGAGWYFSPTVRGFMERLRAAAPPMNGPERVFVTRPAGGRRPLANAAEAEAVAEAAGFAVVQPARLPFPEQVALFAGAHAVAGPMGAGLTLIGAMAQGTRAGMVGPGYRDYFFYAMACAAEVRFAWAAAAPLEPFRPELLGPPLMLRPGQLRRLLAAVAG